MAVVVVGNRPTSLWLVLALTVIMLVIVGLVLFLFLGRGQSGIVVVAIPGFPAESIIMGIAIGLSLIFLKRKSIRRHRT
jgi:hypothetical protein